MNLSDSSSKPQQMKYAGYLFLLSGCAFVAALFFSKQVAFAGVSAAMFGVGAALIGKSRQGKQAS